MLIEGRQRQEKQQDQRMGWLQWMVWQSQTSDELKLDDFLPGSAKEISAKSDPEAFAAELQKMVDRAKRREERKRRKMKPGEEANASQ